MNLFRDEQTKCFRLIVTSKMTSLDSSRTISSKLDATTIFTGPSFCIHQLIIQLDSPCPNRPKKNTKEISDGNSCYTETSIPPILEDFWTKFPFKHAFVLPPQVLSETCGMELALQPIISLKIAAAVNRRFVKCCLVQLNTRHYKDCILS